MSKVFDSVDISTLKLTPPRTSKASSACKTSYIQSSGSKLSIQTPLMTLPWDIFPKKMDENSNVSAALSLSFRGIDKDDPDCELHKFRLFMNDFDKKIKELVIGLDGSLGKKSEKNFLDMSFRESVKESSNGDYAPTIQPKIWLESNGSSKSPEDYKMDISVFNLDGEIIEPSSLTKGCPCAAIIEPSYVWCSALGVGITWVARQAIIKPAAKETFAFTLGKQFDELREQGGNPSKKPKPSEEEEPTSDLGNEEDF